MTESRSVLLVDDVPEILEFLSRFAKTFRTYDLQVVTTTDALEAIALVSTRSFDLVVSDFRMPKANGAQVLAAARAHHPSGLRVLITGYNEVPLTPAELESAGLSARLSKPIRGQDVLQFLQACFSQDPHALDEFQQPERAA